MASLQKNLIPLTATIYGIPPSKSNSYQIIKVGNAYSLGKQNALKKYEKTFYMQVPAELRGKLIADFFSFSMNVYYPSMRADLDNSTKVVLDCLQAAKVIKNDNKCIHLDIHRFVDKKNPRIEFKITPITF